MFGHEGGAGPAGRRERDAFPSELAGTESPQPGGEASATDRHGKGVTTGVRLPPHGTVVSEDISLGPLEGNVTKVTLKVANKGQGALKLTL